MKTCPYCKNNVEENWSYCRNCNKPLIVNLQNKLNRSIAQKSISEDGSESPSQEIELPSNYDNVIFIDESLEQKLSEISLEIQNKSDSGEPIGDLWLQKAGLYYQKRDLENALKALDNALHNFLELDDLLNVAIVRNEMGLINEEMGFFDDAIFQFEQSEEILKNIEDYNKLIQVYNNIANIYHTLKEFENSLRYYNYALQLTQKLGLVNEEVKTHSNIVDVLFSIKNYDQAFKTLDRNLAFFKQKRDAYGVILTLTKFGKLFYFLGGNNIDNSFEKFKDALEILDTIKDKISIFTAAQLEWECYFYLSKLSSLRDDFNGAEDFIAKSLEAVRTFECCDSYNEGIILEEHGNMYLHKGEVQKAIEYYELCLDIFYKFGDDTKTNLINEKLTSLRGY